MLSEQLFSLRDRGPELGGETNTETQFTEAVSPRLAGPQEPPGPTLVADVPSQEQTLFDLFSGWVS